MDHLHDSKGRHNIFANVDHDKHYNDVNFVSNKKDPNKPKDTKKIAISELNLRKKLAKAELQIKLESRGPTFHQRKLPKDTTGLDPNTASVRHLHLNDGEYSESDSDDNISDNSDLSVKSNHTKNAGEYFAEAHGISTKRSTKMKYESFGMESSDTPQKYRADDESRHYNDVVDHFVISDSDDEESFTSSLVVPPIKNNASSRNMGQSSRRLGASSSQMSLNKNGQNYEVAKSFTSPVDRHKQFMKESQDRDNMKQIKLESTRKALAMKKKDFSMAGDDDEDDDEDETYLYTRTTDGAAKTGDDNNDDDDYTLSKKSAKKKKEADKKIVDKKHSSFMFVSSLLGMNKKKDKVIEENDEDSLMANSYTKDPYKTPNSDDERDEEKEEAPQINIEVRRKDIGMKGKPIMFAVDQVLAIFLPQPELPPPLAPPEKAVVEPITIHTLFPGQIMKDDREIRGGPLISDNEFNLMTDGGVTPASEVKKSSNKVALLKERAQSVRSMAALKERELREKNRYLEPYQTVPDGHTMGMLDHYFTSPSGTPVKEVSGKAAFKLPAITEAGYKNQHSPQPEYYSDRMVSSPTMTTTLPSIQWSADKTATSGNPTQDVSSSGSYQRALDPATKQHLQTMSVSKLKNETAGSSSDTLRENFIPIDTPSLTSEIALFDPNASADNTMTDASMRTANNSHYYFEHSTNSFVDKRNVNANMYGIYERNHSIPEVMEAQKEVFSERHMSVLHQNSAGVSEPVIYTPLNQDSATSLSSNILANYSSNNEPQGDDYSSQNGTSTNGEVVFEEPYTTGEELPDRWARENRQPLQPGLTIAGSSYDAAFEVMNDTNQTYPFISNESSALPVTMGKITDRERQQRDRADQRASQAIVNTNINSSAHTFRGVSLEDTNSHRLIQNRSDEYGISRGDSSRGDLNRGDSYYSDRSYSDAGTYSDDGTYTSMNGSPYQSRTTTPGAGFNPRKGFNTPNKGSRKKEARERLASKLLERYSEDVDGKHKMAVKVGTIMEEGEKVEEKIEGTYFSEIDLWCSEGAKPK